MRNPAQPTPVVPLVKTLLAVPLLLLALAGCGDADGTTATDSPDDRPTAVPAAPGSVSTRGLAMVMDTGEPELCLGPVAESWPPQCGGPAIDGWDWDEHQGMYESEGKIRWGQFALTGTWDGTTFGYQSAVAAPVYDVMPEDQPTLPEPSVELSQAELEEIAGEVGADLPGAQGAYANDGHVLVDVTYDDGSLQDWVDQEYGEDVVVVTSMLVDVQK